jgi:hypothetical protein
MSKERKLNNEIIENDLEGFDVTDVIKIGMYVTLANPTILQVRAGYKKDLILKVVKVRGNSALLSLSKDHVEVFNVEELKIVNSEKLLQTQKLNF